VIRLHHLEAIMACLTEVSALVDLQAQRSATFQQRTVAWLRQAEDTLRESRHPGAASLAALRSRLVRTLQGDGLARRSHKAAMATTSDVLVEAEAALRAAIDPALSTLAEADALALQVASVARVKGLIDAARSAGTHRTRVAALQGSLKADPDTMAAMVRLEGLVGPFDVAIILDRAVPELT